MFDSSALDVAVGLSFVFFLFSLAASKINEIVVSVLGTRHQQLEAGIRRLVEGTQPAAADSLLSAAKVLDHSLVTPLRQPASGVRRLLGRPSRLSYLPSRTFSAVVLDLLAPEDRAVDPLAGAAARIQGLAPANPARTALLRMLADAQGDRDAFRHHLEHWYDDAMDRVSGTYKRKIQWFITGISLGLVVALNIDSVTIAEVLWRVPTERAAVAGAAGAAAAKPENDAVSVDDQVRAVRALSLPLGWTAARSATSGSAGAVTRTVSTDPRHVPVGARGWWTKLLGLLISVIALSFGAPFWFDALGNLAQLRQTGPKPAKATP